MLALFGSEVHGGGLHPLLTILVVVVGIFVFLKFCGWAQNFQVSGGFKKIIFILTAIALVGFNVAYSMGNKAITQSGDWGMATTALVGSLVWVCIFAFALMAETK